MDWNYDSQSRRAFSGIDAPAFGDRGLTIQITPDEARLEPFEEANHASGAAMEAFLLPQLMEAGDGGLELDPALLEQTFAAGGESPDPVELVSPEQLAAIRWLERQQKEIYALIYGTLREIRYDVQESEKSRQGEQAREAGYEAAEYDAVAYGTDEEADPWGDSGSFDSMWEGEESGDSYEEDEEEEEWLWEEEFALTTAHVTSVSKTPEVVLWGSCSWDEEHGLGVRLKGLKVVEVSTAMGVRR